MTSTPTAIRTLLASTPPPPPTLWATAGEDAAILALRKHGHLTLPRFDAPGYNGTTLSDLHLGAIRLFDRGAIALSAAPDALTDTHATWMWNDHHGESVGLRLQRWRTLTFLPYQTGHYGLTPEDGMSGPLMAAVLVWHHAHTGVRRLDLSATTEGIVTVVEHHHDPATGTTTTRTRRLPADAATRRLPLIARAYESAFRDRQGDDFSLALLRRSPHLPPADRPEDRLHPVHEDRLLYALCTRIAPTLYAEPSLSVDLNTWLLHRHGEAPVVASASVPLDVADALTVLGAPPLVIDDPAAARRWATTSARVTFGCKGSTDGHTIWKHRHILQVTPTGGVGLIAPRSPAVRDRSDADHLLAALNGRTATCVALTRVLDGTDASTIRGTLSRLRISTPATADRLEAAHRVARWLRHPNERLLAEHLR